MDMSPKMEDKDMKMDTSTTNKPDESGTASVSTNTGKQNPRKRKAPEYTCGEDWSRAKTTLPDHLIAKFKDIETMISEYVQFKPEFFKLLTEQASKGNAKVGHGPSSGVCGTLHNFVPLSNCTFPPHPPHTILLLFPSLYRGRHYRWH